MVGIVWFCFSDGDHRQWNADIGRCTWLSLENDNAILTFFNCFSTGYSKKILNWKIAQSWWRLWGRWGVGGHGGMDWAEHGGGRGNDKTKPGMMDWDDREKGFGVKHCMEGENRWEGIWVGERCPGQEEKEIAIYPVDFYRKWNVIECNGVYDTCDLFVCIHVSYRRRRS